MLRPSHFTFVSLVTLALAGCGGSDDTTTPPSDTGTPADTAVTDSSIDSALDTAADSGADTQSDGGADTTPDGADSATDAAKDAETSTDASDLEAKCLATGGSVGTASCCTSVGDFPNNCLTGACGCSPSASHTVKSCNCPAKKCFDGTGCVPSTGG